MLCSPCPHMISRACVTNGCFFVWAASLTRLCGIEYSGNELSGGSNWYISPTRVTLLPPKLYDMPSGLRLKKLASDVFRLMACSTSAKNLLDNMNTSSMIKNRKELNFPEVFPSQPTPCCVLRVLLRTAGMPAMWCKVSPPSCVATTACNAPTVYSRCICHLSTSEKKANTVFITVDFPVPGGPWTKCKKGRAVTTRCLNSSSHSSNTRRTCISTTSFCFWFIATVAFAIHSRAAFSLTRGLTSRLGFQSLVSRAFAGGLGFFNASFQFHWRLSVRSAAFRRLLSCTAHSRCTSSIAALELLWWSSRGAPSSLAFGALPPIRVCRAIVRASDDLSSIYRDSCSLHSNVIYPCSIEHYNPLTSTSGITLRPRRFHWRVASVTVHCNFLWCPLTSTEGPPKVVDLPHHVLTAHMPCNPFPICCFPYRCAFHSSSCTNIHWHEVSNIRYFCTLVLALQRPWVEVGEQNTKISLP